MSEDFEIKWSRDAFPIEVIVDTNLPEPLMASVTHALYVWNEALDRQVFVVSYMNLKKKCPEKLCGWIAVNQNDELDSDGLWRGYYREDHIVCSAQISFKMNNDISDWTRNNLVIHEFGHALGLAHDEDDKFSVMHPKVWKNIHQHITKKDIEALKEQYFNREHY